MKLVQNVTAVFACCNSSTAPGPWAGIIPLKLLTLCWLLAVPLLEGGGGPVLASPHGWVGFKHTFSLELSPGQRQVKNLSGPLYLAFLLG